VALHLKIKFFVSFFSKIASHKNAKIKGAGEIL
jgi:hypothetical protein